MLVAGAGGCSKAAEAMCGHTDFSASAADAEKQLSPNPALDGLVVDQATAVEIAGIVFGRLLGGGDR